MRWRVPRGWLAPSCQSVSGAAWLACHDFDAVRKVLTTARSTLGEILSAVEFLDRGALDATLRAHPDIEDPLQTDAPSACSSRRRDATRRTILKNWKVSSRPSTSRTWPRRSHNFSDERVVDTEEGVSDAMTSRGFVYKYDVSLPPVSLYDLVENGRQD